MKKGRLLSISSSNSRKLERQQSTYSNNRRSCKGHGTLPQAAVRSPQGKGTYLS